MGTAVKEIFKMLVTFLVVISDTVKNTTQVACKYSYDLLMRISHCL